MSTAAAGRLRATGVDRAFLVGFALVGLGAMVVATGRTGEQATTLVAHAGLVFVLVVLSRVISTSSTRPLRLGSLVLLIAMAQPVSLLIATAQEGPVIYYTRFGPRNHHDGTIRVAVVTAVFYAMFVLGTVLARRRVPALPSAWSEMFERLPAWMSPTVNMLALASGLARLLLLFPSIDLLPIAGYSLRIFTGVFVVCMFYVGGGVRRGRRLSWVVLLIQMPISALTLLSGSRADALLPIIFMAAGFLVTVPMSQLKLYGWMSALLVVGFAAMFVGQVAREDRQGRTGDAAIARLSSIGNRVSETAQTEGAVRGSTVRRLLRNGSHAVITNIPEHLPFERDGLSKIPREFAERLLPALNFSGISQTDVPRNWMLNDLGFYVNWSTSLELAAVPDAWFRGGYLGVILVGLIAGLFLQAFEDWMYRLIARRPDLQMLALVAVPPLSHIESRDFIWGIRAFFLMTFVFLTVMTALRVLRSFLPRQTTFAAAPTGAPLALAAGEPPR